MLRAAGSLVPKYRMSSMMTVSGKQYHSLLGHRGAIASVVNPQLSTKALLRGSISKSVMGNHQSQLILSSNLGAISYFSSFGRGGKPPSRLGGASALGAGAVVLMGKGKYILGALKMTKFASLGSMIFSIGTYSMFFGLPYAAGMVGLIAVHEAGHAAVMVHRKIPFSPMVFVPFVGATIAMRRGPQDAWEDALVAFGGPVLGTMGAAAVSVGAHMTDSQLLFALADFGYMINLFNLMPLGMMDGGRIAGALSPYAGLVGLGMGGTLIYAGVIYNPLFYLIMLAGGYETFQRFYNPASLPPNYYRITPTQRAILGGGYFGLIGAIFVASAWNHQRQKPPELLMQESEKSWVME